MKDDRTPGGLPPRHIGDFPVEMPIGFGAMHLSTEGRPSQAESFVVLDAAYASGIRVFDTADAYCLNGSETGHNERLLGAWLRSRASTDVLVSTKGGHVRDRAGAWLVDGRPEHILRACTASLDNLGTPVLDLYHLHRPDPAVPFSESVGALARLLEEGKIARAAISNVTVQQIREATAILPLAAVQNRLSADFQSSLPEVALCADLDIAFIGWGPLQGLDVARAPQFVETAKQKGVTPQVLALAWQLRLAPVTVPIPGSRRAANVCAWPAALQLNLSPAEMEALAQQA